MTVDVTQMMMIMMMAMMMITYPLKKDIPHMIPPVVPLQFLYHENSHLRHTNDVGATTIGYVGVCTCDLIKAHIEDVTCHE